MSQLYPWGKKYMCIGMPSGSNVDKALFCASNLANCKALLLWEGGAFNPAHQFVSSVVAGSVEMSGGSYSRQVVANLSLQISGNYLIMSTASVITFSGLPTGHTTVGMVFYFNIGADSVNPVWGYYDGGSAPNDLPKDTNGGDLVVSPNIVDGYFRY